MIGHEITALHGLDHGQTLAVVFPGTMASRKQAKRAKLLQYAERVWGIRDGGEEERIDGAIEKTRGFFESVGVKTRLKDYGVSADVAQAVSKRLAKRGWIKLGERKDVGPREVEEILAYSV
jgi:NADP-dependent alcohol dehydrogenase